MPRFLLWTICATAVACGGRIAAELGVLGGDAHPEDVMAPDGGATLLDATTDTDNAADIGIDPIDTGPIHREAGGPLLVFVTDRSFGPSLVGLAGADALCNEQASSARLPGHYMAWLSDDSSSPSTRFRSDGPYVRVDGVVVATDFDDLRDGSLMAPINRTATGTDLGDTEEFAWTNTRPDGNSAGGNACGNWSGAAGPASDVGRIGATDAAWTYGVAHLCTYWRHRLYCFEQP